MWRFTNVLPFKIPFNVNGQPDPNNANITRENQILCQHRNAVFGASLNSQNSANEKNFSNNGNSLQNAT